MELTSKWVDQVLDYVATHHNAKITYHVSDMRLLIHINVSYLNDHNAKNNYGDIFSWDSTNLTMLPTN